MRRLKCEKETIILTNEDDGFYDVYTFNQSLQKRLREFALLGLILHFFIMNTTIYARAFISHLLVYTITIKEGS